MKRLIVRLKRCLVLTLKASVWLLVLPLRIIISLIFIITMLVGLCLCIPYFIFILIGFNSGIGYGFLALLSFPVFVAIVWLVEELNDSGYAIWAWPFSRW